VTVRRRASDPWFDDECRTEKRSVPAAERLARRSQSPADIARICFPGLSDTDNMRHTDSVTWS